MNDTLYIQRCLELVEAQFNRGKSQEWSNYDFEKLGLAVQAATGVALSVTTLKRVFGKVKYNSAPAVTTLNALSRYAGFEDWSDFRSRENGIMKMEAPTVTPTRNKRAPVKWGWWIAAAAVAASLSWIGWSRQGKAAAPDPGAYRFSSNKILTAGVPNSVVFNYNAAAAGSDTVFITQSWDIRRKKQVSKDNNAFSSIYYYPGYFRARLMVGNKIMQHHDLMITSGGWLGLVEKEAVPVYFKQPEVLKNGLVQVTDTLLSAYHLSLQPTAPAVRFFNVLPMPGWRDDNFTFETTLRNNFNAGSAACQHIEVLILCKNDVISIPLSAKGCVGDLYLAAAGKTVSSTAADLSGFGCDAAKWIQLKVESVNRHMRFWVNGKEAYALDFPNDPSEIVGLQYRFQGPAAVKEARFKKGKEVLELL